MTIENIRPWYRQFWPWFLMIPPAGAVVGGLFTFYLAGGPPALVVDDYGKIAMVTEQRANRDKTARELDLAAHIEIMPRGDDGTFDFRVKLTGNLKVAEFPQYLHLRLIHPTLPDMDVDTALLASEGMYLGAIRNGNTRMYLQLTDPDEAWRLTGELLAAVSSIELVANRAP